MRKRSGDEEAGAGGHGSLEDRVRGRIAGELGKLGIDDSVRSELAARLEPLLRGLSPEFYGAVLAGVSITHRVHGEREAEWQRNVLELSEIHRLLGVFSEELRRLDAALQKLMDRELQRDEVAPPARVALPRRRLH